MKQRLVYLLKLLALVSLTAFFSSSSALNAQNKSKAIEITDEDGNPTILYEESHALVIWAGNYQHWSRLNNVEVEAKQVKDALEQRGFKVTTLGNPTGESLRNSIKNFIDNYGYKPDNRLVLFFTGHGHTRNSTKGYLVPVDAPDPIIDDLSFLKYAFPMQQIITWARLIEAKHALFVFDSCFSGTVFKTKASPRPENAYIRDVMAKPVRQFIAAGDADQEVPAKSIFTPLFIRGLEGEADYTGDGYVTGSELGLYLTQTLREYTSAQTPQYGKIRESELDRGDIVFRSLEEQIPATLNSRDPSDTTSTRSLDSEPTLISKATRVDYTRLRDLLASGKWKEADIETSRAMLQAAGREKEGWLSREDLDNFSCEDLRIIDQLWLESSQGKFGFSVQKDIFQNLGGTREYNREVWENFSTQVGWRQGRRMVNYSDISFNLNAPKGQLPATSIYTLEREYGRLWMEEELRRGRESGMELELRVEVEVMTGHIISRAANCNL